MNVMILTGRSEINVRCDKFVRKDDVMPSAVSIYFYAEDGLPLQPFRAGQYLMLRIPGMGERAYVLSAFSPQPKTYRITVTLKGWPDTTGHRASTYWHDTVATGDVVEAVGPPRTFHLPDHLDRPFLFISSGTCAPPITAIGEELPIRAPLPPAPSLHPSPHRPPFA